MAHETPVLATGTRPTENSDKRELFKESTTTALVFPNGGVIRLSAAVDAGQLLFLTNEKTRREVVAQVTRKRTNPSAGFYVELEFTEPAPGFWGIEFPEGSVPVPANPQQQAAVELMHSAEPAPDDLSPSAPAPTAAEVQALVDEVEALRAQLKSMQTQSPAPAAEPPPLDAPAPSATPAPPLPAMLAAILNQSAAAQKSAPESEHAAPSAPATKSAPPAESHSAKEQLAPDPAEDLLPKPNLDFQKAKTPIQIPPPYQSKSASGDRLGTLRLGLLAAVSLFAVFAAAWNMHLLPWLSPAAKISSSASSAPSPVRPPANSPSPARPAPQQKPDTHADANAATQTSDNSANQPNSTDSAAPQSTNASPEAPSSEDEVEPANAADATPKRTTKKDSAPLVSVAKRSPVPPTPSADDPQPDDNAAIVPPRLIKSVKPIAPSDALQSFVTGNVTLDALIDKSGHVESMKVLSGPSSFHKAAMEALKQYRYEPARQHGKPVPTHVTVTVPFLFEP